MKIDWHCLYIFRHDGLTLFQHHIGWDKVLGFSMYIVLLNILLIDVTINHKPKQ